MQIKELFIYPVKSLQGIKLEQSQVFTEGLPYDRQWMLVDAKGQFVTQRQFPALATIKTQITDTHLILSNEKVDAFSIPLKEIPHQETPVVVWKSELNALDEGLAVSEWLAQAVGHFRGQSLRLVRFNPSQVRAIKAKYLKQDEQSSTYFADGFPYLVTSVQTLDKVNDSLEAVGASPVGMERFRANIVVDSFENPFDELFDHDLVHTDGQFRLSIRKPCERCPVTTVDQKSGQRQEPTQPLTVLRELNPLTDKSGAYFGGNAILVSEPGAVIKAGDQLIFERI